MTHEIHFKIIVKSDIDYMYLKENDIGELYEYYDDHQRGELNNDIERAVAKKIFEEIKDTGLISELTSDRDADFFCMERDEKVMEVLKKYYPSDSDFSDILHTINQNIIVKVLKEKP